MVEQKQKPIIIAVLIIIIVAAVVINIKKITGKKSRHRPSTRPPSDYRPVAQVPSPGGSPNTSTTLPTGNPPPTNLPVTAPTVEAELKRLTSGPDYDTQPVFSPNGREIAYVSFNKRGQNIYMLRLHGSEKPVRVTTGDYMDSHPSWTPDSKRIIFTSNRRGKDNELFWVDKFTGDISSLNKEGTSPVFSPDGEWLAFIEQHNIWIMKLATKEFTPITKNGYNDWPSWDRDGKKIYFSCNGSIKTVDIKSLDVMPITSSEFSDYPAVSSQDNRLVYVSLESGRYDLWMMNSDGSGKEQLTGDAAREYFPSWSPDGTSIVFASNASGPSHLWLLTLPQEIE